jgi:hypothetical protein
MVGVEYIIVVEITEVLSDAMGDPGIPRGSEAKVSGVFNISDFLVFQKRGRSLAGRFPTVIDNHDFHVRVGLLQYAFDRVAGKVPTVSGWNDYGDESGHCPPQNTTVSPFPT